MNLPLALVATIFAAAAAKENHSVTLSDASRLVKTNLRVRSHPVYPTKLRNVASLHPELEKLRYLKEDKQNKQDRQEKDDEMVEKQAKQKQEKQDKQEKVEKAEQKAQKEDKDGKDQKKEVAAKNKNHSNLGLWLGITFSLVAIGLGFWFLVYTGKVKVEPIKEYFQKIPDRFSEWKKQKLASRKKVQPDQTSKAWKGVSGNVHSVNV